MASRPVSLSVLSISVVVLAFAACSSDDKAIPSAVVGPGQPAVGGGSTSGGDSGTDGGADADAATDAPLGPCLPESSFGLDGAFGGVLAIRGTVSFPAPLPAQRRVEISVVSTAGGNVRSQSFAAAAVSDRFTYRVGGLTVGKYVLRVQADATGNGVVNDPGDYDGYFDGTATGPILNRADAAFVDVVGACVDGINFGAGVKP